MNFVDFLKKVGTSLTRRAKESLDWYFNKVKQLFGRNIGKRPGQGPIPGQPGQGGGSNSQPPNDPTSGYGRTNVPEVGKMYLYYYDPKHKDKMPFWDTYPLIIFLENVQLTGPGFLAMNLHYLPPLQRAALLTALWTLRNNNNMDNTTRLNVTYDILKRSARFPGYEQCVKRYLYSHVRSSFFSIDVNDWDRVVLLPLQRWVSNPNIPGSPPY